MIRIRQTLCLVTLYAKGMALKSAYISAFKVYDGRSSPIQYARDEINGWNDKRSE